MADEDMRQKMANLFVELLVGADEEPPSTEPDSEGIPRFHQHPPTFFSYIPFYPIYHNIVQEGCAVYLFLFSARSSSTIKENA